MGMQTTFFFTEEDEKEYFQWLAKRGDVLVFPYSIGTRKNKEALKLLPIDRLGNYDRKVFLVKKGYEKKIEIEESDTPWGKRYEIPDQYPYLEYSRCSLKEEVKSGITESWTRCHGRIYLETQSKQEEGLSDLKKWYRELTNHIKKNCTRWWGTFYVGRHALAKYPHLFVEKDD